MEEHEQIDPARGMKYCSKCAYWYHITKGCDCDVADPGAESKQKTPEVKE